MWWEVGEVNGEQGSAWDVAPALPGRDQSREGNQDAGDVRWNVEPISPRERPSSLAVLSYSFPP